MKTSSRKKPDPSLPIIGWREWVGLPDFGIDKIKVKVDTGAKSSSLHAFRLKIFTRDEEQWARFEIQPVQRKKIHAKEVEAKITEFRSIRSSNGIATLRPVIVTSIHMMDQTWPVELTLANRDQMGFRMLLGREALRKRFLVDVAQSFCGNGPQKSKKFSGELS